MSAKAKGPPTTLVACQVGDVAETPCGWLLVTGNINGCPLVRLWLPDEKRTVSQPFGVQGDLAVLSVSRKPMSRPPAAGGTFDPVNGGG